MTAGPAEPARRSPRNPGVGSNPLKVNFGVLDGKRWAQMVTVPLDGMGLELDRQLYLRDHAGLPALRGRFRFAKGRVS